MKLISFDRTTAGGSITLRVDTILGWRHANGGYVVLYLHGGHQVGVYNVDGNELIDALEELQP